MAVKIVVACPEYLIKHCVWIRAVCLRWWWWCGCGDGAVGGVSKVYVCGVLCWFCAVVGVCVALRWCETYAMWCITLERIIISHAIRVPGIIRVVVVASSLGCNARTRMEYHRSSH